VAMNRRFLLLIGMILVVLAVLVAGCAPGDQDTASANKLTVHMTIMDPELSPPAGCRPCQRDAVYRSGRVSDKRVEQSVDPR
jgi:hypothetical protein